MQTALEQLNEDERKEYWACLALKYAPNIGARTITKLLKYFGSAYTAVHSLARWAEAGLGHRAIHIQNNSWRERAKKEWNNARDLEAEIILYTSDDYPYLLKEIPDAPSMFYILGNKELLQTPSVAIIGSRECSELGEGETAYLAKTLSSCGVTIVSGMARGIDRSAHFGALQEVGSSIGVLGSGIDIIYPQKNDDIYFKLKEHGLLISEFAPTFPPDPSNFPIRNRIISGLSHGVIVIEADLKSGSLITARLANEQSRQVYAIPGAMGSPYSKGCQELIRQCAKSIFGPEDVLEDLLPILKADLKSLEKNIEEFKHEKDNAEHTDLSIKNKILSQSFLNQDMPKIVENKKAEPKKIETQEISKKIDVEEVLKQCEAGSIEYLIIQTLIKGQMHFEELCALLEMSAQELTVALTLLELQNTIKRLDGGWYQLC